MKKRKQNVERSEDRNAKLRLMFREDVLNHLNRNAIVRFYNVLTGYHVKCSKYKRTPDDIKNDKHLNVTHTLKFYYDKNELSKTLYVERGDNMLKHFDKEDVIPKSDPDSSSYKKVVIGFLKNRKNYVFIKKLHETYWMIYTKYELPWSIDGQKGLSEWCYHALFNIIPNSLKRKKETMIVKTNMDYKKEINHLELCGVSIPFEVVVIIFDYIDLSADSKMLFKIGLVNWNFFNMCLANWEYIKVTPENIYKFPITVLNYVRDVTLCFIPLENIRANHINHLLKNLENITRLRIYNTDCRFIKKKTGHFSNCKSLILDYYNGITEDQINNLYKKFPRLEELCISNRKTNPIPKNFDFLRRIKKLYLVNNTKDIKNQPEIELPDFYSRLEHLKELTMDFSFNLSYTSRLKLAKLKNLKNVCFSVNGIYPGNYKKITDNLSGFFESTENKLKTVSIVYKASKTMLQYHKDYVIGCIKTFLEEKGLEDVKLIIKHVSF